MQILRTLITPIYNTRPSRNQQLNPATLVSKICSLQTKAKRLLNCSFDVVVLITAFCSALKNELAPIPHSENGGMARRQVYSLKNLNAFEIELPAIGLCPRSCAPRLKYRRL